MDKSATITAALLPDLRGGGVLVFSSVIFPGFNNAKIGVIPDYQRAITKCCLFNAGSKKSMPHR